MKIAFNFLRLNELTDDPPAINVIKNHHHHLQIEPLHLPKIITHIFNAVKMNGRLVQWRF